MFEDAGSRDGVPGRPWNRCSSTDRRPADSGGVLKDTHRQSGASLERSRCGVTDRLLDAGEVADRLNVPKSWVLESARSGALPCLKLGRYTRFSWPDVEAWL